MRQPELRARLLASPPVLLGSWAIAIWLVYQWTQSEVTWLVVAVAGFWIAAVMKADERVRAYKAWKREWDAMAGVPPPSARRRGPFQIGIVLGPPLVGLLVYSAPQGGGDAVIGVLMILLLPLVLLAGLVKLWQILRRRRSAKATRSMPVSVCVGRALIPVPSLQDAYRGLPDHCRAIMRSMP